MRHTCLGSARALCPEGMIAVGGCVDVTNTFEMSVTSNGPVFPGDEDPHRLLFVEDGEQPARIGWQGSATNSQNFTAQVKVAVVCLNMN